MLGPGDDACPGPSEPVGQKALRASGVCPKAECTRERQEQAGSFTIADLVELYLSESRVVVDSQVSVSASLAGASSKPKQSARRTLFNTLRAA
ncbi:hypothetical protein B5T_03196 [Alloalcanivorax dieselolei B5]|uniref:Uncharacterized protein n=1 Tax=Alcanivorax dieselolei (strain DSM 16502 / CGMCC 1.3690 / MCCC 1A00001 / B-5) TaxID=930169 RepID=K0CFL9_ALCDB|nr:hypothetical protein B5T_03196 [Alloalcanivorax dieselolei B5]GGJ90748.1 hypothetical protein GCM10007426_19870 [Alloalcanivorax dieselolei]